MVLLAYEASKIYDFAILENSSFERFFHPVMNHIFDLQLTCLSTIQTLAK